MFWAFSNLILLPYLERNCVCVFEVVFRGFVDTSLDQDIMGLLCEKAGGPFPVAECSLRET